jgi:hypothetical protein
MLKVKIFDEEHEDDLEEKVNDFLKTIPENNMKDIQFRVAAADDPHSRETVYCFSVMIVYRPTA